MRKTSLADATGVRRGMSWYIVLVCVVLGIIGLPVAVWLDLTRLSDKTIAAQASEIARIIDGMRGFYASDVVGRVLGATQPVTVLHNYDSIDGAIPIPATMSIQLAKRISIPGSEVSYRFVSDLPFKNREQHALDAFELKALASLRADSSHNVVDITGSLFDRKLRLVTPVIMGETCVGCHNSHPDSPKTDWKIGDVRGIQEVTVEQPIEADVFTFKYLLAYFGLAVLAGLSFIVLQRRQSKLIGAMNRELTESNDFLAEVSLKIAKYIPPQTYKSIFSGQNSAAISTERKKLTIFYSDIKDFAANAEELGPDDVAQLLNDYLTAMTMVAHEYGGTVDKFIGDALLVFFGDPDTRGPEADAKACLQMAHAMRQRLHRLNIEWRRKGIERPLEARMGINTGYCNIGNFGSDDRMEYTIIGAEANLAARLQTLAEPGDIVISGDTFALVKDIVRARPESPLHVKGISRKVVPYVVEGILSEVGQRPQVISEHATGLDLFLDIDALDEAAAQRARQRLTEALAALDRELPASTQAN